MAVAAAQVTLPRSAVIAAAREQLRVLETAGAVSLFGAAAHAFTDDLTVQRIDVDDVAVVGAQAVALMVQRGRRPDGTWTERRLSAVFHDDAPPALHGSWVAGLDAASRA
jgi:hypothetical protein